MGAATLDEVRSIIGDQHEQVKSLIKAVQECDPAQRQDAFKDLCAFLAVHEAAEQEWVHGLAKADLPSDQSHIVDDRTDEEEEAAGLISELEQMDTSTADFAARFDTLGDAVVEHAEAEEHQELPRLQGRASMQDLATMHAALLRVPAMVTASDREMAFKEQLRGAKTEFRSL